MRDDFNSLIDNEDRTTYNGFNPFVSKLRRVSNDDTPLNSKYVSFYTEVYDLIDGKDDVAIKDVYYDESNKTITFTKIDGTKTTISVEDNFLEEAEYSASRQEITFKLNDSELPPIKVSTEELERKFYTKEETEEKIEEINNKLVWGTF